MPVALPPRDYQTESIDACFDAVTRGLKRFSSVLATGLGKTVIFSHLSLKVANDGHRILILVHRDELVKQTVSKVHTIAPHLRVGVVKAERKEFDADVVVASVQTLGRFDGATIAMVAPDYFRWIVIDECHHAAAQSYVNIITYFGAFDPNSFTVVAGFTATLTRADKKGLGDIFQENVFKRDIIFGIRKGHLVSPVAKSIELDIENGDLRGGADYTDSSLGDALLESDAGSIYAHAIREYAADRQGVIFAPTVASAEDITASLISAGFTAETVTGATPTEDRDLIFKRVRTGETQWLVNCMVLTEGFDLPQLSCIIPRMTKNEGLFAQMIGRGLRLWKDHDEFSPYPWMRKPKTDCLVLCPTGGNGVRLVTIADLSETTAGMEVDEDTSLIDLIDEKEKREKEKAGGIADLTKVKITDIDLFAASSSAWLQTKKGYWFLATKDWIIGIYPEDSSYTTYTVGSVFKGKGPRRKGQNYGRDLNLDYAKAWAESVAEELDPTGTYTDKGASWKRGKAAPSEYQVKYAKGLGIKDPESFTKAQLSDKISIAVASTMLDRYEPPARENVA